MGFGTGVGGNQPNLELLMQRPGALGKVFFVDSGGSSSNEGTDPAHPLDAISDAMDLCTASKGDVIVVMQLSPSTSEATETWPIALDTAGVLLTGLYSRGYLSDSGFGTDEVDTATINVSSNYITVENLYLGIKTGSTASDVVVGTATHFAFTLRNCLIEAQYAARYGYHTGTTFDAPYLLIEDCIFGGAVGTDNFTNCIRLVNTSNGGMIRRNMFRASSSYGIHVLATCGDCAIVDNDFQLKADTDGFAVYVADGATNNYIANNRCAFGRAAPGNKPFYEAGSDGDNDWAYNWKGETGVAGEQ